MTKKISQCQPQLLSLMCAGWLCVLIAASFAQVSTRPRIRHAVPQTQEQTNQTSSPQKRGDRTLPGLKPDSFRLTVPKMVGSRVERPGDFSNRRTSTKTEPNIEVSLEPG